MNPFLFSASSLAILFSLGCTAQKTIPQVSEPLVVQRTGLANDLVVDGSLSERQSELPADLVVFYGGEEQGSLETCGCPKRPRGSLARVVAYIRAHQNHHPETPTLFLNGGRWLSDSLGMDGKLRADAPIMNQHLIDAFDASGLQAANVSYLDLPGLEGLHAQGDPPPSFAVSANVSGPDNLQTHRIVEVGEWTIGITGITKPDASFAPNPSFSILDPVDSAVQALEELAKSTDYLVLLAFDAPEEAKSIAAAVPALDLIVDTRQHRNHSPPIRMGQTLWVKTHYQTMRLGELRVRVLPDGSFELVVDRKIDMDAQIPDDPDTRQNMLDARSEIHAVQSELFGLDE